MKEGVLSVNVLADCMCMRIELTVRRKPMYAVAHPSSSMGVSVKISRNLVGREKICASRPNSLLRPWSLFFQKSTRLNDCPWFLIRIGILCFGSVNYCSFPVLVIALWIVLFCVIYAHISNKLVLQYLGFPLPLFIQEYLLPTCVAWSVDSIW